MKYILKVNTVVLAGYALSLLLSKIGFPYLQYIFGLGLFIVFTLNVAWALSSVLQKTNLAIFVFALGVSPLLFAIFNQLIIIFSKHQIYPDLLTFSLAILNIIALTLILILPSKNKILLEKLTYTKISSRHPLAISILFALIFFSVILIIYPFIPEADSYTYLINLRDALKAGEISDQLPRSLFYSFNLGFYFVTKIPLYWSFKIVLPILTAFTILLTFYAFSKKYTKNNIIIILGTLLPFTFPIISMETVYPRPQLLFICFFVSSLLAIYESLRSSDNSWQPLLYIGLALSVLGIKMHDFFIYSVIIFTISICLKSWETIKAKPISTLAKIIVSIVFAYPWIRDLELIKPFIAVGKRFGQIFQDFQFDLWFIDNYINTDGNQMGWPGLSSILYYGYNLGLVSISIFALWLVAKKIKHNQESRSLTPFIVSLILFFVIAEVLPRFKFAFLPDRAWLFVALSLSFLLVTLIGRIKLSPAITRFLVSIFILSAFVSWSVAYLKQGWVTPAEYKFAKYIEEHTPENSIIITQTGNFPMVSYFANRVIYIPPKSFFTESNIDKKIAIIDKVPTVINSKQSVEAKAINEFQELQKKIEQLPATPVSELKTIVLDINKDTESYFSLRRNADKKVGIIDCRNTQCPIYILYSKDKFNGLYGKREWWKEVNFYNADLEAIEKIPGLSTEKVDNSITLYKYEKVTR